MAEEHDPNGNGNGHDDEALFPHRRPPLKLVPPRPDATAIEVARRSADAILAIAPRVNEQDRDIQRLTIAVLALPTQTRTAVAELVEPRLQRIEDALSRRPSPMPGSFRFNPELTQGGGVRFEPAQWQAIQEQLAEQDEAIEKLKLDKARAEGAADAAATAASQAQDRANVRRGRLALVISAIGVVTAIAGLVGGWLLHG